MCGGVHYGERHGRRNHDPAIKACLAEIRQRLDEAARIAKAADVCAQAGSPDEAVTVALDIEQLCYEATRLLDAASLINRLAKE